MEEIGHAIYHMKRIIYRLFGRALRWRDARRASKDRALFIPVELYYMNRTYRWRRSHGKA